MENFRERLSQKTWFRTLADRVFGNQWIVFLLCIGEILFLLYIAIPGLAVPVPLVALSGLCYGLTLLGQLLLSLDFYEERAKTHFSYFAVEFLILLALIVAGKLGYLEEVANFLL